MKESNNQLQEEDKKNEVPTHQKVDHDLSTPGVQTRVDQTNANDQKEEGFVGKLLEERNNQPKRQDPNSHTR